MAGQGVSKDGETNSALNYAVHIDQFGEPAQLGAALIDAVQELGLQSNVELRLGGTVLHLAHAGTCSPIVIELFDMLKGRGRLQEFSQHLLVNYDKVSLLILTMPEQAPQRHANLREQLCALVAVTDKRLSQLCDQLGGLS
ncbi:MULTISPECIES: hypothetical protein [unclassified Pseudoalteromonas]|uniref:hypothetical protein n=1 Tax=unclassified Pseudoalteromonas TaxID=194690 RepID=UPI000CF70D93|nr:MULTISPECIES: hypothetical protein [unclassified Pseudoalteromonas]MBS3797324.1 hypothetical protein [Pseudoalteromonas sp. BDTF-M6]